MTMVLVGENRLKRYQKTKYRLLQGEIWDAWDRYSKGNLTVTQLLDKCGQTYELTETN